MPLIIVCRIYYAIVLQGGFSLIPRVHKEKEHIGVATFENFAAKMDLNDDINDIW